MAYGIGTPISGMSWDELENLDLPPTWGHFFFKALQIHRIAPISFFQLPPKLKPFALNSEPAILKSQIYVFHQNG